MLLVVGHALTTSSPGFAAGAALKAQMIESVVATPLAETVTVAPQARLLMDAVVIVAVPLAIVTVQVAQEITPVEAIETGAVPLKPALPTFPIGMAVGKSPVA